MLKQRRDQVKFSSLRGCTIAQWRVSWREEKLQTEGPWVAMQSREELTSPPLEQL